MFRLSALLGAAFLAIGIAAPAHAQTVQGAMGKLMHIDRAAQQIVLLHGPIEALGLAEMATAFRLSSEELLRGLQLGDYVLFDADRINGVLAVRKMEKSEEMDPHHSH